MRGEGMPLRDDPASFGDLHVKVPKGFQNRAKQSHCHCQRCVFIPHSFLTSEAGVSFWYCILWLLVQLLFDLLPIQTLTHLSPVHVLLHSPIQHLFMFHFYLFLSNYCNCMLLLGMCESLASGGVSGVSKDVDGCTKGYLILRFE